METLVVILIIAVIWLFIKLRNSASDIEQLDTYLEELFLELESLKQSVTSLEQTKQEQVRESVELRFKINNLESSQILQSQQISQIQYQSDRLNNNTSHLFDISSNINNNDEVNNNKLNDLSEILQPQPNTHTTHTNNSEANSSTFDVPELDEVQLPKATQVETQKVSEQTQQPQQAFEQTHTIKSNSQTNNINESNIHNINNRVNRATPPKIPVKQPKPSLFETAMEHGLGMVKNWLTTGNIPVKVGMLVLITSVIAFLRYATTMGWIHTPIEVKLLSVVVAALGALAFAWKKRDSKRSFSLIVQGGSIGIILLTIFSAVQMYSLISPFTGFMTSVLMVGLCAVLSIQQNAKALAVMAIFAGFLAPIWLSDGSGSHVVLFSYYAILNIGIFILAMFRPWRELNVLGFVFTYLIGSTWGTLNYIPEQFSTTEPFVILFFIFYLLIPLRYAQQSDYLLDEATGNFENTEDEQQFYNKYKLNSGLVFGTPLVTLGLQVALLEDNTHHALSCVAIGLIYGGLAWWLRSNKDEERMLTTLKRIYTGLSATFLTLAVPIGLSAKATSTIFALEGAGAVWLGAKSNHNRRQSLTWLAGGFLQFSSALAFFIAYKNELINVFDYGLNSTDTPIFNTVYISGILLTLASLACTWFNYYAVKNNITHSNNKHPINKVWLTDNKLLASARLFFIWGMVCWLSTNIFEIIRMLDGEQAAYASLILFTVTATILPIIYHHRKGYDDESVWNVSSLLIMVGGLIAIGQFINVLFDQFLSLPWAIISWIIYAVGGFMIWRALENIKSTFVDSSVVVWLLSLTLTVSTLVYQVLPSSLEPESGWGWSMIFAIWITIGVLDIFYPQTLAWLANRPSNKSKDGKILMNVWQRATSWIVISVLGFVFAITTIIEGSAGWWLPVINSVDSLQIGLGFLILAWCIRHRLSLTIIVAYTLCFAMVGSITLRMFEHWTNLNEGVTDGQWLMIFGFWTLLASVLWGLLTDKLSAMSDYLEDLSEEILPVFQVLFNTILVILLGCWMFLLLQSGTTSPWLPFLNPLEILQWVILGLSWLWASGSIYQNKILEKSKLSLVLACMILAMITVMTLRFVYHLDAHSLSWNASMFNTAIVQMALTLVWSVLGVVSWIVGSKRLSKSIWLLGALLMAVVLIKLIVIDREHLGDLFGISSFFGYGLLCVIVGYFAPIPQIAEMENTESLDDDYEK